jgi:hypothetical protein
MDLTLIAKNPDLQKVGSLDLTGKFDYKTAAYSVESAVLHSPTPPWGAPVSPSPPPPLTCTPPQFNIMGGDRAHGASAGITMDCPGLDGVVLGLNPGFSMGNTGVACPIALGYAGKGFDLAFVG